MDLSVLKTLGIVDCTILLRTNVNTFSIQDSGSDWVLQLFPEAKNNKSFVVDDSSIFLSDFLLDAESFWSSHQSSNQVSSGIWTEQRGDNVLYLEAFASKFEEHCYLIIKNAEKTYYERKQTLQIARELSISHDEVIERHDYLNERLRSILLDNSQAENRLPLHEAIRYASIGVMITDAKLFIQDINPAAFNIFDKSENKDPYIILESISTLIGRQYPEKDVFNAQKQWEGELFYHVPPLSSKWLNVNIHPVFGNNGKLSHWIFSFSDQTRMKHLLQTNEELALHDPLTGLPNRQYFWQTMQQSIADNESFFLLSIDIVNFKYANELYGYLAGDELLKQMASKLRSRLDEKDFITRIGADEFMIIRKLDEAKLRFNQTTFINDTLSLAQELQELCVQPVYTSDDRRCELPIKIGLTQFPVDTKKPEELLNYADLALSYAKTTTNNPIQFYNEQLRQASSRRLLLEEALKNAIDNNELELYLQPIYDIVSNKVIKAEALIRWRYAGQIIMPGEFIPIAESSDSINVIGRWVISRTCEIIKQLEKSDIHIPISINFSPKQIYDTNLVSFIRANTESMGVKPSLIELEVTEGVLINSYKRVSAFLGELKRQGFSISVDDFGTGYCSLAYLKHLPIDTLKIDSSFIKDVGNDADDSAIVSAIIALAKQLKLSVIAEGIETIEQQTFLRKNNCTIGQGFLFSQALNVKDFTVFIKEKNRLLQEGS